jgi:cyclic dehypoxanthinyl futalosine synthase
VRLLEVGDLLALGSAANEFRERRNDRRIVTYLIDRNINYTNVCVYRCQFCAFYRPSSSHPEAYVLSFDQIGEKIQELLDLGGTGVLLQGGVNGDLPFSFYEEMFRFIRKTFPGIHLHALSAPEIYFLQKITKWPMEEVIHRLRDAGCSRFPEAARKSWRTQSARGSGRSRRRRRRSGSRCTRRRIGWACAPPPR